MRNPTPLKNVVLYVFGRCSCYVLVFLIPKKEKGRGEEERERKFKMQLHRCGAFYYRYKFGLCMLHY